MGRRARRGGDRKRSSDDIVAFASEAVGHDDFIVALALPVRAAGGVTMAPAAWVVARPVDYADGRY